MTEEKIIAAVEEALNPTTFDVLSYVEDEPQAEDEIKIYVGKAGSRKLANLLADRRAILAERKKQVAKEDYSDLSIAEADEDTELDPEINELIKELDKTALTFKIQTVAPKLVRAIEKSYAAKRKSSWDQERKDAHAQKGTADILSRAIKSVTRGDGAVDPTPWTPERLIELEDNLYAEQGQRLVGALYDMVYTGQALEDALTVDF